MIQVSFYAPIHSLKGEEYTLVVTLTVTEGIFVRSGNGSGTFCNLQHFSLIHKLEGGKGEGSGLIASKLRSCHDS
jgi:hypothetical protein